MKKTGLFILGICFSLTIATQNSSDKVRTLLDEVSTKMSAYRNMSIDFTSTLVNKKAGITDSPIRGNIILSGEKYNLNYLGNNFVFNGKRLAIINAEEKEVTITNGDLEKEDGFIYPSKLLTFYKEGYTYEMGTLKNNKGRKVQYLNLTPIDSNSDIIKVQLGIDAKTKHIYKLVQTGSNGTETTFTITKFKINQAISANLFYFNRAKYEKLGYLID